MCQAIERPGRLNNQDKEKVAVLKALKIPENSQEVQTINQENKKKKLSRQVSGPVTQTYEKC